MQVVEDGHTGIVAIDRLAVDCGRCDRKRGHSFPDAWIALGPVVAAAGEQAPPAGALARDEPVAVVLDFVNPLRAHWRLRGLGRDARFDDAGPLRGRAATPQHARKM